MQNRVIIFVDFWNLVMGFNKLMTGNPYNHEYKIPWDRVFPDIICKKVSADAEYFGVHVYASHSEIGDEGLKKFFRAMQNFRGYKVILKKRKRLPEAKCNVCHKEILQCPHCDQRLLRYGEKGVDTTLAIDLFQYAMDKAFDTAVLVSSDTDFVPAVEYIERKGCRIVHAGFRNQSNELRSACWGHFFIEDILNDLVPGIAPFVPKPAAKNKTITEPIVLKKQGSEPQKIA